MYATPLASPAMGRTSMGLTGGPRFCDAKLKTPGVTFRTRSGHDRRQKTQPHQKHTRRRRNKGHVGQDFKFRHLLRVWASPKPSKPPFGGENLKNKNNTG